ncbi:PPE family protein [Mycobacterium palustre]|uniref:PPE family protein, SVP subgroup n=1 Tax=Mycobacterium palustre TaxID=153971 RepID=UPI000A16523F|nr:PPE family protein [Mycobacterium palustre]
MDFAALPPEVNSGRMYAGAGAGPLLAAAAAWDGLSAQLSSTATEYQGVVSELTGGSWLGPASMTMAAAVSPYITWMSDTAAQAAMAATQARAAAAAYEAAFIATVPPPLIAENRALLALLVATNVLGQNTPAIAATEAQYSEMWAQDAAAMYGYAGSSAAATQLSPFSSAPQTTNAAGTSSQADAVSQATGTSAGQASNTVSDVLATVPNALQQLSSGASADPFQWLEELLSSPTSSALNTFLLDVGGQVSTLSGVAYAGSVPPFLTSPLMALALPAAPAAADAVAAPEEAAAALAGSGASTAGGLSGGAVSAGLGEAGLVGDLSVPQSWASAAPQIRLASTALPLSAAGVDALPAAAMAGSPGWFGGMAPVASVVNAPRRGETRSRVVAAEEATPQAGSSRLYGDTLSEWAQPDPNAPDDRDSWSEREELNRLRKGIAAMARERDVLKRSAALLVKEAMNGKS